MGLEATTLAYIGMALSAAGAGAQAYTSRQTAKGQDEAAARGIRNQQMKQREIDSRVNESIGALERSGPEDERAASLDQFLNQLRSARSQANGGDVPITGGRYGEDVESSQAAIGNYGEKVAGLLSRIRAASDQRTNEGNVVNRMGSDVSGVARNAAGQAFIDQLRARGITENPWVNAAGDVLKGVGSGMNTYAAGQPDARPARSVGGMGAGGGVRPPGYNPFSGSGRLNG